MTSDPTRRLRWAVLASFVTALLIGMGSMVYAKQAQQSSEQQWCSVLGALVARYREPTYHPADAAAAQFATYITTLYDDFGCVEVTPLGHP